MNDATYYASIGFLARLCDLAVLDADDEDNTPS